MTHATRVGRPFRSHHTVTHRLAAIVCAVCLATALAPCHAQTAAPPRTLPPYHAASTSGLPEPPASRGAAGLLLALERLNVVASALHTVAHPDDEDNGLLVYLSRGRHARTVLLSATRGEGGQSLIGPEKADAMGLVRTGEMRGACRYYGAELRFARTFDFGFSKSAEETLGKWGRRELLGDFVRVIRQERPDIIVSRFGGSEKDGHGHHQAVGIITREAFRAAADPQQFPEQIAEGLTPWQASGLYVYPGRAPADAPPDDTPIEINYGQLDPVLGRSYHEIGVMGLRRNRSQGMFGRIAEKGPVTAQLVLLDSATLRESTDAQAGDLFGGIDTSISGIAERIESNGSAPPWLVAGLASIEKHALAAIAAYEPRDPQAVVPHLAQAISELRKLIHHVERSELPVRDRHYLSDLLRDKQADFVDALTRALNLEIEVLCENDTVVPGETFDVTVSAYRRGSVPVTFGDTTLHVPDGWQVQEAIASPQESTAAQFAVTVANDARPTQPFFYRESSAADRYTVRGGNDPTLPFGEPDVTATVPVEVMGAAFDLTAPLKVIDADRSAGVMYRDVQVVPALSVKVDPPLVIQAQSNRDQSRAFRVIVTNHRDGETTGTVKLLVPDGWRVEPASHAFRCAFKSASAVVEFDVVIPAGAAAGEATLAAVAQHEGRDYDTWHQVVSYPHTWRRHLYHPAQCVVRVCDLKIAPDLRVGYILGRQDEVPLALTELGVDFDLLDAKALEAGDLSEYDIIVAGVRAYQFRDDLRTHNQRLLDYVSNGGVFLVQYNKTYDWDPARFTPYPTKMTHRERITDEAAEMTMLVPDHPVFTSPNRITRADFDGWVQERGLYFMTDWDARYTPLLAGHDPGEAPLEGSLIVAEYGEGLYVYTALAWFRQLPAGVPGAYRMFANLLSLPATR